MTLTQCTTARAFRVPLLTLYLERRYGRERADRTVLLSPRYTHTVAA